MTKLYYISSLAIFFSPCALACCCSFIIVGSAAGRMDPLPNQTQHQWHSKNCVHESLLGSAKLSFSSHERVAIFLRMVCCLRIVFLLRGSDQPTTVILRMLKSARRTSNSLRNVDPRGQMNYGASGARILCHLHFN